MKKITNTQRIQHEQEYIQFLTKRLNSKNFLANESKEEVDKTKAKLAKARLILRCLESK